MLEQHAVQMLWGDDVEKRHTHRETRLQAQEVAGAVRGQSSREVEGGSSAAALSHQTPPRASVPLLSVDSVLRPGVMQAILCPERLSRYFLWTTSPLRASVPLLSVDSILRHG